MAYKLDENKRLIADKDANPIWINDAGEETPVDYNAITKRIADANGALSAAKQEPGTLPFPHGIA